MKRQAKTRAFTLIEILVVVAILGTLMGLISIFVVRAGTTKRRNMTKLLITSHLRIAIDRYKQEFKRYPPATVGDLNKAGGGKRWKALANDSGDEINGTTEVLLVALNHADLTAKVRPSDWGLDDPLGNGDDDEWNQTPDGLSTAKAREIKDGYGNTVVYLPSKLYNAGPVRITNQNGDEVEVFAVRKPDGTFYNPTSYQLISVGENGKQDAVDGVIEDTIELDDIMNFSPEVEDEE